MWITLILEMYMVSVFIFETVVSLDLAFLVLFGLLLFSFEAQKITVRLIITGYILGELYWVGDTAWGSWFPRVKGAKSGR